MRFFDTTLKYLENLSRDIDYVISDKQLIIDYLINQNIQSFEKIIEFQTDFSGIELTITNKPNSTFQLYLFSRDDIKNNRPIETLEIEGKLYFSCGEHMTAQFWFVISSDGQICTYDNNHETINIISSSLDKFIETYAFEDFLGKNNKYEHPYHYNLIDNKGFEMFSQDFTPNRFANDEFNKWLSNEDIVIHKGIWYDNPKFSLHFYGDNIKQCENIIQLLQDKKIIS